MTRRKAGASAVEVADTQADIATSSVVSGDPISGSYTVANTTDWVYVIVHFRAGASTTLAVTDSEVGGANPVTINQYLKTADAQFHPSIWVGRFKPTVTGTRQLNIDPSATWFAGCAHAIRVTGAHASPDGNSSVIPAAANGDANTMSDSISTTAGSLVFLAANFDGGDTDPFTPNNDTNELVDTATGTGTEDSGAFVGWKQGDGGTVTVGVDASASDDWCSIAWEVLPA